MKRVSVWDGSEEKWNVCSMQFKAFAFVNNFKEALDKSFDGELPVRQDEELDPAQESEKIKAVNKNSAAVAHLTISCSSDEMMAVICGCCSDKWPEGKTWEIWAAFTDRCQPEDQMTEVEFNLELAKLTLKENDEPRKLFENLATINARYGNKADEGRLMAQVHIATPQKYLPVLQALEISHRGSVTLKMYRDSMQSL